MLRDNAEGIFDLLSELSSDYSIAISNCAAKIRVRILDQKPTDYCATELELFSSFIMTMHERTHPIEMIDKKNREAFERFLPVLKKDLLARLWPSEEKMITELKTTMATLAIESGAHKKIPMLRQLASLGKARTVVLVKDYKAIKDKTSISIDSSGGMKFKIDGAKKEITVKTETLKRMIKREKPPHLALHDILTMPPSKFDSIWGRVRQESHKRRFW